MLMVRCGDCENSFRTVIGKLACRRLDCYVSETWFCASGHTRNSLIRNGDRLNNKEKFMSEAYDEK